MLANPPSELTKPQGDELILPDGSMMSKEQQDALEQRYHDAAIAQIPDAKAKADYFKQVAENADASQYVDPELAKTIPARIAHAAGSAGVMAVESMMPFAGIPFMVMHGAMATEAEAKNAGKTDAEAEAAGVRSAIGLALFGGASKLAALGVAKLLPDGASSVRTFLTQFVGQEAANETSSRAIRMGIGSRRARREENRGGIECPERYDPRTIDPEYCLCLGTCQQSRRERACAPRQRD
jgi:hypothetical protein